jgi:hypothetical protein
MDKEQLLKQYRELTQQKIEIEKKMDIIWNQLDKMQDKEDTYGKGKD